MTTKHRPARPGSQLSKAQWIDRYGGQALLDAEGFDVVPCENCDDSICHGWRIVWRTPARSGASNSHASKRREWIIQRCTQRWKGKELIYEDWPLSKPGSSMAPLPGRAGRCDEADLLSFEEMETALARCAREWPDEEFKGHNVAHCRHPALCFSEHEALKGKLNG